MPEISYFFGISITMNQKEADHRRPHIHARYAGIDASFDIMTGDVLAGSLPPRQTKQVKEWIALHRDELFVEWDKDVRGKIEPLH